MGWFFSWLSCSAFFQPLFIRIADIYWPNYSAAAIGLYGLFFLSWAKNLLRVLIGLQKHSDIGLIAIDVGGDPGG